MKNLVVLALAANLIVSCTTVGPRTGEILRASEEVVTSPESANRGSTDAAPFAVVEADRNVAFTWKKYEASRGAFFSDPGPGRVTIQSGDVLSISLVSTSDNGFVDFTTASVNPISTTTLPMQRVTELGTINVPPVGRVQAQGRTIPDLEDFLNARLGEVLVNPSVVVELAQRNGALVSVVGDVGAPGSFAYTNGDARLLDMVSLAGGASSDLNGLEVSLSRRGEVRSVPLTDLYREPRLNVHARPGDVISVDPRSYSIVVLGASGKNEQVEFDTTTMTLSNVLGQIGGLENRRADPKGVFLYRPTPRRLAEMLGINTFRYPGDDILTIYQFDLTKPGTFFTLTEFEVRDGDILYVANSRYEEVDAALDVFTNAILRPIQIGRAIDSIN